MSKKAVAVGSALASIALALGAGFGVASATEPRPSGDNCTVNGDFNVVVAPNCQAGQPAPSTGTAPTGPTVSRLLPYLPDLSGFIVPLRPSPAP